MVRAEMPRFMKALWVRAMAAAAVMVVLIAAVATAGLMRKIAAPGALVFMVVAVLKVPWVRVAAVV